MKTSILSIFVIILLMSLSFNQVIIAKNESAIQNAEPNVLTVNLFGEKEYNITVSDETLKQIDNIINKTRDELTHIETYSSGWHIILIAIHSLYNLGLFPDSNYTIIQDNFKNDFTKVLHPHRNNYFEKRENDNTNYTINNNCFVVGHTDWGVFWLFRWIFFDYFYDYEMYNFFYPILSQIIEPLAWIDYLIQVALYEASSFGYFGIFAAILLELMFYIPVFKTLINSRLIPVHFFNFLDLGVSMGGYENYGWIYTKGLHGTQDVNGYFYSGVSGFTGIGLSNLKKENMWFVGFGLKSYIYVD